MVQDLAAQGISVLLVEQFVEVALQRATHVVVLRKGAVRLSANPDEVRHDRTRLTVACSLRDSHVRPAICPGRRRPCGTMSKT